MVELVVCCFSWTYFVLDLLSTLTGFLSRKIVFCVFGFIQIVEFFCDEMKDTKRWNNFGSSRASHFLLICIPLLFYSCAIASSLRCDVTCYIRTFYAYWFLFVYCFFHVVLMWLICLFCFLVLQHEYLKNNKVKGALIWFFLIVFWGLVTWIF